MRLYLTELIDSESDFLRGLNCLFYLTAPCARTISNKRVTNEVGTVGL